MANKNGKGTDDLLQLISNQWWSVGESRKFDLNGRGVSDAELPVVLQKIEDKGLDYELSKSSNGKNTLKVYKSSDSSILETARGMTAAFLLLVAMFPTSVILMLMLVCVYPFFTFVTKLLGDGWISLEDFYSAYWDFVLGWD